MRDRTMEIRHFIIRMVEHHPHDIAVVTGEQFGITTQAVGRHLKAMQADETLTSSGKTKAKRYELKPIANRSKDFQTNGLQEDLVWSQFIEPLLVEVPKNVLNICNVAASEMINNVIDHSESSRLRVEVLYTPSMIDIKIRDYGVGVFSKVTRAFNLIDERQAILELSKGKLTTAPKEHSGYGIFFTSRMVDLFKMWSGTLYFTHTRTDGDWLIAIDDNIQGTFVQLTVSMASQLTIRDVYDKFCEGPDSDLGFSKTHVPLKLAEFGSELLVSRSQAKRVLARVDRFQEVWLDFTGIETVGQGFIDEIFRVYAQAHPNVTIRHSNANSLVKKLINLAHSTGPKQLELFKQDD